MRRVRRFVPLLMILAVFAGAYVSGLTRYLSIDAVQAHQVMLQNLVMEHPAAAVAAYVGLYALVTGAALPAALMLTLAGGFLFGPLVGGAATVVGATLGAFLTYAAMRSAFGRPLRRRAEQADGRLRRLIDGFGANAFSYVLSLRLLPMAPFPLVNMAAGLADAPARPYVLATVIGAMPTSFLFSSVGSGLGHALESGDAPGLAVIREPYVVWPLLGLAALSLASVAVTRWRLARAQSSPPERRVATSPK